MDGNIDPARDIETINLELALSDLEMVERRIDKTQKLLKGDKSYQTELELLGRVREALNAGKPARSVSCNEEEAAILSSIALLTNKPVIYAANLSEADFASGLENNPYLAVVERIAAAEHAAVLPICAEIEAEIAGMRRVSLLGITNSSVVFLGGRTARSGCCDRPSAKQSALQAQLSYTFSVENTMGIPP